MTQEEIILLIQDLCARLPYGVICNRYVNAYELVDIDIKRGLVYLLREEQYVPYSITSGDVIKPYLRPMSSMTFEERSFCLKRGTIGYDENDKIFDVYPYGLEKTMEVIDFLNAHHFDYRGLIAMGLALPAPEGMYDLNQ